MGLLDDAIREHLDLKRRRGADPAEIERAEREALGPVRRAPEPQDADEREIAPSMPFDAQSGGVAAHDEVDWEEAYEDDHGDFEPFDHAPEPPAAVEPELHEPPPPRAAAMPEPEGPPTQHMPLPDHDIEDEFEQPSDAAVPRPHPAAPANGEPPSPERRHPSDHLGGETVEYEVEGEFEEEGDEDVLEETPEFLQDTPDHDRLWFEQRPPKDFDFDG